MTTQRRRENVDVQVVDGFGHEWERFDQAELSVSEASSLFARYFAIFPWDALPPDAVGFDAGCGSGRWARLVAPRVGALHCIDASPKAISVAAKNLASQTNCTFHVAMIDDMPLKDGSQDFGYSLGVLHHLPDTLGALKACTAKLKPGSPFLLYLYYRFDNRPTWFKAIWYMSTGFRLIVSRLPFRARALVCDVIAGTVYWPMARAAALAERCGARVDAFPLSTYRALSFYVMRTDALDRFGTRLERRFERREMQGVMERAGLTEIVFQDREPYWVALGYRCRDLREPGPA